MIRRISSVALAAALSALAAGCSGNLHVDPLWVCDVGAQTGCPAGQYCEFQGDRGSACFAPVLVTGAVVDASVATTTYVSDARVVALDPNRAPVSTVATTPADGSYALGVRARRDANGRPLASQITLRADAQGYQRFPGGIRPSLPIDLSTARLVNGSWTVTGPLTRIELLAAGGGAAWIEGTVARPAGVLAPLVVAEPQGGGAGVTGLADPAGGYAIFNLAAGTRYVVKAYARGARWDPVVTGSLVAGGQAVAALGYAGPASASFGGDIIKNQGATLPFDVTLVVSSTYVASLDRGESPPGLTVPGFFSSNPGYRFSGVPDGSYRVLAAFGKDGDVRLVNGTGNTVSPNVTISGGALLGPAPAFKIIPAVPLVSIGGVAVGVDPITVVSTDVPVFEWMNGAWDSNAASFRVTVYDAFGAVTWTKDQLKADGASSTYGTGTYPGTVALEPGATYQVRVLAIKEATIPADYTLESQTEDVLGVFTYVP